MRYNDFTGEEIETQRGKRSVQRRSKADLSLELNETCSFSVFFTFSLPHAPKDKAEAGIG